MTQDSISPSFATTRPSLLARHGQALRMERHELSNSFLSTQSEGGTDGRVSGYKRLRAPGFSQEKRQVVIAGEWVTHLPC